MEHKLISGGEQYLPFARSRIKALRATGLKYASQQFEADGCSIKVRIEGDQEFIELSGGEPSVLSGVVRGGKIVSVSTPSGSPVEVLRDYKPTEQSRRLASVATPVGAPREFNDEPKLVVALADRLSGTESGQPKAGVYPGIVMSPPDSQYEHITGSMFSGKMAKLVQIIMGYGRTPVQPRDRPKDADGKPYHVDRGYTEVAGAAPEGVTQVLYDYRWLRCHGVVTAADGKMWLIEISKANGVIAMPLPMRSVSKYTNSRQDVLKEAGKLFGGLPSGATFPADELLPAALELGDVIRLASVASMAPFFANQPFSSALGWSFKMDGSEAHNTCWTSDPLYAILEWHPYPVYSYHYKLAITIGISVAAAERLPKQPVAEGQAVLTLVESGELTVGANTGGTIISVVPFSFAEPNPDPTRRLGFSTPSGLTAPEQLQVPAQTISAYTTPTPAMLRAPLLACHINDKLDVVRMVITSDVSTAENSGYQCDAANWGHPTRYEGATHYGGRCMQTDSLPVLDTYGRSVVDYGFSVDGMTMGTVQVGGSVYNRITVRTRTTQNGVAANQLWPPGGLWAHGIRDGYVYFKRGEEIYSQVAVGNAFQEIFGGPSSGTAPIGGGLYMIVEAPVGAGAPITPGSDCVPPYHPPGLGVAGFSGTFNACWDRLNSVWAPAAPLPPSAPGITYPPVISRSDTTLTVVLPVGDPYVAVKQYPSVTVLNVASNLWHDSGGWFLPPGEPRIKMFTARCSVLSSDVQAARSDDITLDSTVTTGTLVPTEAPTLDNYSFIGYT